MKTGPPRHFLALVSLLIFLLSGQAGVQGYVWCLGDDGHATLEFVASDSCGPIDPMCGAAGIFDLPSGDEHCGPCSDLPASFEATSRRDQDQNALSIGSGFSSTVQLAPPPSFVRVLTANLYPNPPPRISRAILAHRTIVLLN